MQALYHAVLFPHRMPSLVLVLGLCFFAGGLRFTEQAFDACMYSSNSLVVLVVNICSTAATQVHSSLLSISVGAVLLPAAYHFSISGGTNIASFEQRLDILQMSHGVRFCLYIGSCLSCLTVFNRLLSSSS